VQLIGIAYNPKKITTPPTSWEDLWKPEYKGRVGITGSPSSLGTAFMVEIAKLHWRLGNNIEPAFEAVKKLLPNVGRHRRFARCPGRAVPAGRIDNRVQLLEQRRAARGQGRRYRLRQAESGAAWWCAPAPRSSRTTKMPRPCSDYLDTVMSMDVQERARGLALW